MAEHADATESVTDERPDDPDESEHPEESEPKDSAPEGESAAQPSGRRLPWLRTPVIAAVALVAALGGLAGWLAYHSHQNSVAQHQRNQFVQAARQAAVDLTSISFTEADTDIQRIIDSATGTFRDDFEQRSAPFVEVVKRTQSTSRGTVADAGLESESGGQARVLVAVSVKTSIAAAPEQDPRRWRMRISVEKVGDDIKVSNVEFVP
ncbi:mammalian cell entry protein [Mycolicibacterium brisbanense]